MVGREFIVKHCVVIEIEADSLQQLEDYLDLIPSIHAEKFPLVIKQPPSLATYVSQINDNKISYRYETKE